MKNEIILYETGMEVEAGKIYSGMPNETYHHGFIDWFSSTDLKCCLRSLEYFLQELEKKKNGEEREPKIAFEFGSAYHEAIQSYVVHDDQRLFEQNVIPFDGKTASKKFLDAKKANPDKYVVPQEAFQDIPFMARKAVDEANQLSVFHEGEFELAFFWIDPVTGLQLKTKLDYVRFDIDCIVDFKSTKDHLESPFSRDIASFGYHFSAAMYEEGYRQLTGKKVEEFVIIAQNKTPPFEAEFYPLKSAAKAQGIAMFEEVLSIIKKRKKHKPEFKPIDIPFWAMTHIEKEFYT